MNEQWITLKTYTYPEESYVFRSRLESEGIEVKLLNEFTVQAYNFASNAIGGIQLQVKESDLELAKSILDQDSPNLGEIKEYPNRLKSLEDLLVKSISFISEGNRFLMLIISFVGIVSAVYFLSKKAPSDVFLDNKWCVYNVNYDGTNYKPNSISSFGVIHIYGMESCNEILEVANGSSRLPGINTEECFAEINILSGDSITIKNATFLSQIYNGRFEVYISENELTLTSQNSIINCLRYDGPVYKY